MRLSVICEAWDLNLASKISNQTSIPVSVLKKLTSSIDPSLRYGTFVLRNIGSFLQGYTKDLTENQRIASATLAPGYSETVDGSNIISIYDVIDKVLPRAKLAEVITHYDTHKTQYSKSNINEYPNILDLRKEYNRLIKSMVKTKPIDQLAGVTKIYDETIADKHYEVFLISNEASLRKISAGTDWCTSKKENAKEYLESTGFQYVILRNKRPTCLFSHDLSQIQNSNNTAEMREEILNIVKTIIRLQIIPHLADMGYWEKIYSSDVAKHRQILAATKIFALMPKDIDLAEMCLELALNDITYIPQSIISTLSINLFNSIIETFPNQFYHIITKLLTRLRENSQIDSEFMRQPDITKMLTNLPLSEKQRSILDDIYVSGVYNDDINTYIKSREHANPDLSNSVLNGIIKSTDKISKSISKYDMVIYQKGWRKLTDIYNYIDTTKLLDHRLDISLKDLINSLIKIGYPKDMALSRYNDMVNSLNVSHE